MIDVVVIYERSEAITPALFQAYSYVSYDASVFTNNRVRDAASSSTMSSILAPFYPLIPFYYAISAISYQTIGMRSISSAICVLRVCSRAKPNYAELK